MAFTTSKAQSILKDIMGGYIGLFTGTPTDSGSFSEPGGSDYVRGKINGISLAEKTATNEKLILIFEARNTYSFTHFGLFSGESGGEMLFYGELTGGGVTVQDGYVPLIRAGELSITLV